VQEGVGADVVILAVPFSAVRNAVSAVSDWFGPRLFARSTSIPWLAKRAASAVTEGAGTDD
jgi:predicted dinucleotide-binding enzyme